MPWQGVWGRCNRVLPIMLVIFYTNADVVGEFGDR
jgi:hypothetical protein